MSLQYMVPGFKLTTLGHETPPIATRPRLPPKLNYIFAPSGSIKSLIRSRLVIVEINKF